jgi:hypothetical protein
MQPVVTPLCVNDAGSHATVERWHTEQSAVVMMCVALLPVAVVPLWQVLQPLVIPVWLNVAGFHAIVLWQVSHSAVVGTWVAVLPVAIAPL